MSDAPSPPSDLSRQRLEAKTKLENPTPRKAPALISLLHPSPIRPQSPKKLKVFVKHVRFDLRCNDTVMADVSEKQTAHIANLAPPNFAEVVPGIYRSSFPKVDHFGFLESLGLKSILTLVPEDYPGENVKFLRENGIKHHQVHIPGNKDTADISAEHIAAALTVVLDRENLPILIHCNKGKHRTGCVVACLRKLQDWAISATIQEYRKHASPKARAVDEAFITDYDHSALVPIACAGGFTARSGTATGVVLPGDHDWVPASASPARITAGQN